jgi:hypothetical protein
VESDLPWIPGAVRAYLLTDAPFAASCGSRVQTRGDSSIVLPYCTVRMVTGTASLGGGTYKPVVQIDAWSLDNQAEDVEIVVWRIAFRASRALETARNVAYQTLHWSTARVLGVNALDPDKSRGDSAPLYRAAARVELSIHNH